MNLKQQLLKALMPHSAVSVLDVSKIRDIGPQVLDANGQLQIVPAAVYRGTTPAERALLGHQNALYGLPTVELVEWIKNYIGSRSAIEIGAAHGVLAQALGIPATDNHMQDTPEMRAYYGIINQKTVPYGAHVERLDAVAAIAKYRPQVVVASWVTHRYNPERPEAGGNAYGVPEEVLLDAVEAYVFIGNHGPHKGKSIWSRPHRFIEQDWVFSRSQNNALDFLCVWEKETLA